MLLGALPPDALQRLLTSLLPAEAVQQLTEQGIDAAFSYLNGQTGQASLGLNQFKERLAANSGSMVDDYFSSLPDCTFEDVLALGEGLLGDGAIPVCNPPEVIREAIAVPLRSTLEQQLDQSLPDSIALQNTGGLDGLFATLRWVRTAAQLTPLLVILLLAAMTLLAVRTPWDILRWWGWPLLAAGLFALAAGLFVAPAATSLLDATFVARMAETVGAAIASLLSTVTSTFAAGLVRPIIVDALLVAAVGGVLVSVSYVTPKRQIA
jgi:hypothetical protein